LALQVVPGASATMAKGFIAPGFRDFDHSFAHTYVAAMAKSLA
jgi:hypothetical protein